MAVLNHTHSYVRYKRNQWKNPDLFKCDNPDCTHFADKALILGKHSQCTCGEVFILSRDDLKRARPKCLNCSNTAAGKKSRAVHELVGTIFANSETDTTNLRRRKDD